MVELALNVEMSKESESGSVSRNRRPSPVKAVLLQFKFNSGKFKSAKVPCTLKFPLMGCCWPMVKYSFWARSG